MTPEEVTITAQTRVCKECGEPAEVCSDGCRISACKKRKRAQIHREVAA